MNSERNLGIERLRIIAMFLIVVGHTTSTLGGISTSVVQTQYTVDLRMNTWNIQQLLCTIMAYMGNLGNAMFIVISSWFLLGDNEVKLEKVVHLIADTFVISVGSALIYMLLGFRLTGGELLRMLLPTTFGNNWFITCYLLIYAIHPMLNAAISSLTQKSLLTVCLVMAFLYCCVNFVIWGCFDFSGLIGFMVIYFMTAYVKFYMINHNTNRAWNVVFLIVGIMGFIALLVITNLLGFAIQWCSNKMLHWTTFCNPFFICIAISSFNIARTGGKVRHGQSVKKIAGVTMFIYLIHENYIVRTYIRPRLFIWIYEVFTYNYVLLWTLTVAVLLFVVSCGISLVYRRFISGGVLRISKVGANTIYRMHTWIIEYILRID